MRRLSAPANDCDRSLPALARRGILQRVNDAEGGGLQSESAAVLVEMDGHGVKDMRASNVRIHQVRTGPTLPAGPQIDAAQLAVRLPTLHTTQKAGRCKLPLAH